MRVLLIGSSGFIGSFLVEALKKQSHSIVLFHRGQTPAPPGVEEIIGDRNQMNARGNELRSFRPDVVIDLVISSGKQAEELIDVFRGATQRIVMLSSMDVYRAAGILHGTDDGPLQELPLTEDSELRRTLHPYPPENLERLRGTFAWLTNDYDKIPAERVIMSCAEPAGTVLRLPMVYGPGDRLHRLLPVVRRINDGRRFIILPENLAQWRAPRGYVENVAAAIALAATDERAKGRVYNVCEMPAFSELEWAKNIAAVLKWSGEFVVSGQEHTPPHLVMPGNFAQHWTASSERIRHELGYQEPISLEDAILRTALWESSNFLEGSAAPFDYAAEDAASGV